MADEWLKIVDENRNEIGIALRNDVHRFGYWHETFHCWFIRKLEDTVYLYLQLRSPNKRDYPNLLDITVAGHLTADEEIHDGVREIEEEIGIHVSYEDLEKLTTIKYSIEKGDLIDREFAHVYLYYNPYPLEKFTVQPEEVSGIVMVRFEEFIDLWLGNRNSVEIRGFQMNEMGERETLEAKVGKEKFVPHPPSFYEQVIKNITQKIDNFY